MLLATGPQGEAIQKLRTMVAASSVFQERVKKYGQNEIQTDEAGQFIHVIEFDDPEQVKRPFALVTMAEDSGWVALAGGSRTILKPTGALRLRLADNCDRLVDDHDSGVDFWNFVDGVLADLAEISGTDDRLNIVAMRLMDPPARSHPQTVAANNLAVVPFYWCEYEIEWASI